MELIKQGKVYKIRDFFKIAFLIAPKIAVIKIIWKILNALIPSFTVLVTADFIDKASQIFYGTLKKQEIILPLFGLLLIAFYSNINRAIMNFVSLKEEMKYTEQFRSAVVKKRAKLSYEHIEDNDTWELITRTCRDPINKYRNGFNNIIEIMNLIIQIVSLLFILMTQVWWAAIAITAICIPLFFLAQKAGKTSYEANKEGEKYLRRADYLKGILIGRENVEERALFGYSEEISTRWHEQFEIARRINLKIELKNFIRMKTASLITIFISIIIIGILLMPLSKGQISAGMFMGLVTAFLNLVQMMSWHLTNIMKEFSANKEYLKDFTAFCALSEQPDALELSSEQIMGYKKGGGTVWSFESIEFKHVFFRYPKTENYILKDFNLTIHKNLHYAVVGINGAGKTTITKLLTGLYPDFEGEIKINGIDIKQYSRADLKRLFSVVYQDFAKYFISVEDNIAIGNLGKWEESEAQKKEIQKIAEIIGLTDVIEKLPEGFNTYLGKIKEESADISGGEWQRLAIARALYNKAEVRILDEPTAALDPVAESTIYEMFGRISIGKTTIFITHRLGAAKLADEIVVIGDGKVIEQGSHEKLMQQRGVYAEMFESQRGWYREDE